MRTILKSLTLGLGLLAVSSANAQLAYYAELSTTYSKPKAGTGLGGGLYLSGTHKFNDNWKAGVELNTDLAYVDKGESSLGQAHDFLRFPITRSNLKWIGGDWKTSFTTRWTAPTTEAAHQGATLGALMLRPAFSNEGKIWSVLVRPLVSFNLTDRAYQRYVEPGKTQKGNSLVSWAVEFIPAYKVSDKMSLTLSSSVSQAYVGGAPGADGAFGSVNLGYEVIADIPVAAGPVSFAVSVSSGTPLNSSFKLFDTEKAGYTLYAMASF